MNTASGFSPLRNLRDIENLERVPLEQRLLSWDANDWIRRGLDLAPAKSGDPICRGWQSGQPGDQCDL